MRRSIAEWLRFLTLIQNFCRPPRYWWIAVLRSHESKKNRPLALSGEEGGQKQSA
jgi:hypothetical protein